MVVRGMILAHSFPVAINTVPVVINQDIKALVFSNIFTEYLLLTQKSFKDEYVGLVERSSHGTCKLVSESLWNKVIPIAPISEQYRIVTKVDKIMTLCGELKLKLIDAQAIQLKLADNIVKQLI